MTRSSLRLLTRAVLAAALASLLVAGCGGSASPSTPNNGGAAASGDVTLSHVDGVITVSNQQLTITPEQGAAQKMTIGPAVSTGALQAFATANTKVRVYYSDQGSPIAAKVEPAPAANDGAKTIEGRVTKASSKSITLQTSDGASQTFTILPADASAFDIAHLEEHRIAGAPVRIYYRGSGDNRNAVAYEDA